MAKYDLKTVAVVGLGYVGFPLAVRAKEKGYNVIGFDTDEKKVALLKRGLSPIKDEYLEKNFSKYSFKATSDPKKLSAADVILICVPTPVDEMFYPNLAPIISASTLVVSHIKTDALVVLESTVNPGVNEEIVKPIFEKAGLVIGKDVYLAHCPERINPGDPKWNVTNIPRVVGSFDRVGLDMAHAFYTSIVDGEIRKMKSIREAESVKIVENSFRDINIAFVNELARSFDVLGIDVKDVILGAATKPFAFMPHFPACGVGGHCIPVDPYYLIERAKQSGFDHRFLKIAREINNGMPSYTVEILQDALNMIKLPLNGTRIGILGLAYKANIDDLRESPSFKIIEHLKKHSAKIETYDPYIKGKSTMKSLNSILKKTQAIIVVTDHKEFKEALTPALLKKHGIKIVIDGKNCLDKQIFLKSDIIYKGIGR